jgi:hypothetical protein
MHFTLYLYLKVHDGAVVTIIPGDFEMRLRLVTAAAALALTALPAHAQKVRSMYATPGADVPATTQSTGSPLEGTWVGTIPTSGGGTRTLSVAISGVSGGFARINRDNGDTGSGRVSGNTVSFGNRTPMTMTISGNRAKVSGRYENGAAITGTLTRQ